MLRHDHSGRKIGRLTVLRFVGGIGPNGKKLSRWECRCDCGNIVIVDSGKVNNPTASSKNLSCGCYRREWAKTQGYRYAEESLRLANDARRGKTSNGEWPFNKTIVRYRRSAKERDLEWNLSRQDFTEITKRPCYYCGVEPSQVTKGKASQFIYNGIDRLDPNQGYTVANSVPCCGRCNRVKWNLTFAEFVELCRTVASRFPQKMAAAG